MAEYYALDLETEDKSNGVIGQQTALEPWRQRHNNAGIMSLDLIYPDGETTKQIVNESDDFKEHVRHLLSTLKGKTVWGHNITFDVAWLIALLQPERCGPIPQEVRDIDWRDTSLLIKWLVNGQKAETRTAQKKFSLSLASCVENFLSDHPGASDFVAMKKEGAVAMQSKSYWLERGSLDVIMTQALANRFAPKLPVDSRRGFLTESKCIVPVANSWVNGIRIDRDALYEAEKYYGNRKKDLAEELGISATTFTSPKKLGQFLFNDMSLTPVSKTKSGNPGTSKEDLVWIRHKLLGTGNLEKASIIDKILEAKESSTIMSKYVKTAYEALDYTGDGYIYGAPRIFGTYTGRLTYSNATLRKFKTGIALHQIPRKAKLIRAMLAPPPNMKVYEADAEQQESRLMAIRSGDPLMLKVFSDDLNFHSMTASRIFGMEYDTFEEERAAEGDEGQKTEERQMGKLTNLSCNYRISGKALAAQSYVKYGKYIDPAMGNTLVNTFNNTYASVPAYWRDVIAEARQHGYTEEFGGRRFKLSDWGPKRWGTESSAIMFPIQGAGASMKEIAISELYEKLPELHFTLDLHDASFGFADNEHAEEIKNEADRILNSIEYGKYWGFESPIALPYESKMGDSFKDVK